MREIRPLLILMALVVLFLAWRTALWQPDAGSRESGPPASLLVEVPWAGRPTPHLTVLTPDVTPVGPQLETEAGPSLAPKIDREAPEAEPGLAPGIDREASEAGSPADPEAFPGRDGIRSSWTIVVDRSRNELRVYHEGERLRAFPVATGYLPEMTPSGRFPIVVKGIEPAWRNRREGRIVPGGTVENPLGSRWLGLGVPGTDGLYFGIHGTNQPGSIGRYVTLGCIRMHNADVEWLFDRVPTGTIVEIIGEIPSGGAANSAGH